MSKLLTPDEYRPRLIDGEVSELLQIFGAVEIDGPKWSGKTRLALNHSHSVIHLDDDEKAALAQADVTLALAGSLPHLIDEWQEVPKVRDAVRRSIDASGNKPGSFILTGSSTAAISQVHHSGAGRIATLHLRPLSLYEAGISDGSISLSGLFGGMFESKPVDTHLEEIAEEICRGGWPAGRKLTLNRAIRIPRQYMMAIYDFSAPKMGKSAEMARRVFRSLARTVGESASYATILSDSAEGEDSGQNKSMNRNTVEEYLEFFKRLYLLEDVLGWEAPVRARARVRSKPKRYLVDPSLAAITLGLSPKALLDDLQTFGRLFEVLCVRDLKVYLSSNPDTVDAKLRYYRDDYGLEVDVIIELSDGRWGAIEIKLSEDKVASGVSNLLRLKDKVLANPLSQTKAPSFMAVLVGRTSYARTTPEGIFVVPITCLTA
jgi:predicted AAA+ superfamily ATPase